MAMALEVEDVGSRIRTGIDEQGTGYGQDPKNQVRRMPALHFVRPNLTIVIYWFEETNIYQS